MDSLPPKQVGLPYRSSKSKRDIRLFSDVRFTPKSGHWNRHVYYLRRNNSGSLAMLAAIRRARRSFHRRLSTRCCGASLFEVGALELAIQMPW